MFRCLADACIYNICLTCFYCLPLFFTSLTPPFPFPDLFPGCPIHSAVISMPTSLFVVLTPPHPPIHPSPPFFSTCPPSSSSLSLLSSFFKKACLVADTTVQETIFFSGEISTRSKTSHFLSLSHIGRCEKARPPPGASRLLGSSWRRLVQPPRGESHSLAHTHRDTPPPQGDAHGPAGGLPQPALLDVPDCHSTFYHPTSLLCELPTDDRGSSENVQI